MIRGFESYHGTVLARLVHSADGTQSIGIFPGLSNASYILNEKIGLYIKYSAKRMSPWQFTFKREHQIEIETMRSMLNVFVVLVCNDDGIVCLSYEESKSLIGDQAGLVGWITATRRARQMYGIKGSSGSLETKVGANEFPEKLFRTRSL
jgi:hypothetical protein